MTWSCAKFGSYLTQNRDGSPKDHPTLWMPPNMRILIPSGGQDHARPFILLEGKSPEDLFTLILHEDHVQGLHRGKMKRLVEI